MKAFFKLIAAFLLAFCVTVTCVFSAHADELDSVIGGLFWDVIEWAGSPGVVNENEDYEVFLRKIWSTPGGIDGNLSVSYDFLSELCVELNMRGYPCHIARSNAAYRIVGDGYILNQSSYQDISGRFLCTTNGAVLEAATNTNLLNVIDFQAIKVICDLLQFLKNIFGGLISKVVDFFV